MDKEPLREINMSNLCTHYILPLLKLNYFRFGGDSNFINCYLSTNGKKLYVKTLESFFVSKEALQHPFFKQIIEYKDYEYIVYRIPAEFGVDIELFMAGKYSRMSEKAKNLIRTYSGLPYKCTVGTKTVTDGRLLALTRSNSLRNAWSDYLNTYVLNEDDELLDKPRQQWFMDLEK